MNKPLPAKAKVPLKQRRHNTLVYLRQHWQLYLIFMLPAFVLTIIFRYIPMGGVAIAFMDYNPFRGLWHSEWVGFEHFNRFLSSPDFMKYLMNTLKLSVFGLLWGFPAPILLAFLLNRILSSKIKQKVQLVLYMPNFISVIVLCGIVRILLSPTGMVNMFLGTNYNFMTMPQAFRTIYIASGIWQGAGWASIIYTAALSNASKDLKEAAVIDGANLIQQIKTVEWPAIKDTVLIQFIMSNAKTLPELVFNAGFGDTDLQKYAKQGAIIPLEDYIDTCMPNLQKVFEQAPEYRVMCTDENGHIWAFPWIEQLGYEKTAIQAVGSNMPFINKGWLDFLGLEVPTTVDDFEAALIAFRDNADALKAEFSVDGSIIPMSFIMNDQDPYFLINGFGEGYGDVDNWRHITVTNDKQVISTATTEGFKKGTEWMHKLYEEGLIDPEAFTQEWSTYVAKGKSGRYGVCFSWDVANIAQVSMDDLIAGKSWVPLPALTADVRNVTPCNGAFTSGFDRGRCVVTALCKNPELVCSWIDQMYAPLQSPQNNWGTYGEDDDFDIFEMSTNDAGDPMLKHTWLGDASPVEVREAESVNGPLAILDSYYGVYVTLPDDAAYRLNWIKDVYTPDMNNDYCYPNVFMNADDNKQCSNLSADLSKCVNTAKSDWVMNGFTDADWEQFQNDLKAYGLEEYLAIHQKYLDAYFGG